jgi:cytochrome b561
VFALVVVRVLWRIVDTQPDPPQVSLWMSVAAKAVQWALYLFLFALPLTAIAGAWLEGHPLTLLAGLEIPSVLEVSHNVGATVATIHTWLGDAILWLAGFHAFAGLYQTLSSGTESLSRCFRAGFPCGDQTAIKAQMTASCGDCRDIVSPPEP